MFVTRARLFFTRGATVDERAAALGAELVARSSELPLELQAEVMAGYSTELFWTGQEARRAELCTGALEIARRIDRPQTLARVLQAQSMAINTADLRARNELYAIHTEIIDNLGGVDDALVCTSLSARSVLFNIEGDVVRGHYDPERGARGWPARPRARPRR